LLTGSGAGLRAHASSIFNHIKRDTNNSTLGLNDTTSTLLSNFLLSKEQPSVSIQVFRVSKVCNPNKRRPQLRKDRFTDFRDTLPVLTAIECGPSYPARVFALKEERFRFSILEAEDLAVATYVQLTL
jgi:hypothetical protein